MRRYLALLLAGLLLGPALTHAQLDPDPDGIGIYFDLGGTTNCMDAPPIQVLGPGQIFLLITNLSDSTGISGWEARLDIEGTQVILDWGCWYCLIPPDYPNFSVGFPAPWPQAPTIVLLDVVILTMDTSPIVFTVGPVPYSSQPFSPAYASGGDPGLIRPLHPAAGYDPSGDPRPVAIINGDCPIAASERTWGAVKTLYR